jgi:membrane-bound lytic murein transglycosylase D
MEPVQVMPAMAVLAASSRTPAKSSPTQMTVRRTQIHTVKGGETLASIARAYSIEPKELAEINGLAVGEPVLVGQILRVEQQSTELPISHLVAKGDSIKKLARRYGVTVKDIQRWNQLAENRLKPGDLILIYPPGSRPTS